MKKNLFKIFAIAVLVLVSLSTSSCGGSKDEPDEPTPTKLKNAWQVKIGGNVYRHNIGTIGRYYKKFNEKYLTFARLLIFEDNFKINPEMGAPDSYVEIPDCNYLFLDLPDTMTGETTITDPAKLNGRYIYFYIKVSEYGKWENSEEVKEVNYKSTAEGIDLYIKTTSSEIQLNISTEFAEKHSQEVEEYTGGIISYVAPSYNWKVTKNGISNLYRIYSGAVFQNNERGGYNIFFSDEMEPITEPIDEEPSAHYIAFDFHGDLVEELTTDVNKLNMPSWKFQLLSNTIDRDTYVLSSDISEIRLDLTNAVGCRIDATLKDGTRVLLNISNFHQLYSYNTVSSYIVNWLL